MKEKTKRLSDAELEIMLVIWRADDAAVTSNYVLDNLEGKRKWALSTLMSVLARLVEKGYLLCDRSTRTNLYSATMGEDEYKASEGKTILEKLYGNSLRNLVTNLYSENAVDDGEIDALRGYLDELQKENGQ